MAQFKDDRMNFLCSFYAMLDVLREVISNEQKAEGLLFNTLRVIVVLVE